MSPPSSAEVLAAVKHPPGVAELAWYEEYGGRTYRGRECAMPLSSDSTANELSPAPVSYFTTTLPGPFDFVVDRRLLL